MIFLSNNKLCSHGLKHVKLIRTRKIHFVLVYSNVSKIEKIASFNIFTINILKKNLNEKILFK